MEFDQSIYMQVFDRLQEGICLIDPNQIITYWNMGAESIVGFSANEMVGKSYDDVFLTFSNDIHQTVDKNNFPFYEVMQGSNPICLPSFLRHKYGHRVSVQLFSIPLMKNNKMLGAIIVFIPEANMQLPSFSSKELEQLALFDTLTGLPNRRFLDNYLVNQMRDFEVFNLPLSVIMIDLDHFKFVNDEFGHDVGDSVLQLVSKTFRSTLRVSDLIGRWGGDEFLAIVHCSTVAELQFIVEKLRVRIESTAFPYVDKIIQISISVGATIVKAGDDPVTITKRADEALYACKRGGRNQSFII